MLSSRKLIQGKTISKFTQLTYPLLGDRFSHFLRKKMGLFCNLNRIPYKILFKMIIYLLLGGPVEQQKQRDIIPAHTKL